MHNSPYQQSDLETDLHRSFGMRGDILTKLTYLEESGRITGAWRKVWDWKSKW